MTELDVPLLYQPDGSWDCGPLAVQMVMEYFGRTATADQVKELVPVADTVGSSTFDGASALLNAGLDVTAISGQPMLFEKSDFGTRPQIEELRERLQTAKGWAEQDWLLDSFDRFLSLGGRVEVAVPGLAHIRASIDSGRPLIAGLRASVLGADQGFDRLPEPTDFHAVVITGYRDGEVKINNPWPRSRGASWENDADVLYGIHSATCAYLDNGWLFSVGDAT